MTITNTEKQFKDVMAECRALFAKKLSDYGASWRILRPSSLTDQLFIKAKRIRSLGIKKESLVGEGIRQEFIALINYGIVGLIQIEKGFADVIDTTPRRGARPLRQAREGSSGADDEEESRLRRGLALHARQLVYRLYPHQDRAREGD
jgi:hypothetical protein